MGCNIAHGLQFLPTGGCKLACESSAGCNRAHTLQSCLRADMVPWCPIVFRIMDMHCMRSSVAISCSRRFVVKTVRAQDGCIYSSHMADNPDWLLQVATQYGKAWKTRTERKIAGLKSQTTNARQQRSGIKHICAASFDAQVRTLNKSQRHADYHLKFAYGAGSRVRPVRPRIDKIKGTGKWKQHTPEQVQRDVFASGARSMLARAGAASSSSAYITNLMYACSLKLCQLQASAIDSFLASCSFSVFQFICDTASYRFLYGKKKR